MREVKRQTKIHIIGWVYVFILGFLKWQYPDETSLITSGFGGLITVIIGGLLIFYQPRKNKESKEH